jgi:hypothetical protein
MKGGEKLLGLTCDGDIVLRKVKHVSLDDLGERIERVVNGEHIDVDKLVAGAIEYARKSK